MTSPRGRSLVLGGALILVATLIVGCRRDPCEVDQFESGDPAVDLGVFSDAETRMELPLTLHSEGDTDVFTFDVIDQGNDGNPQLDVWVTGQDDEEITLTINFQCADEPFQTFSCDGFEDAAEPGFCTRRGRGEQHLHVEYDCIGGLVDDTDNGFATVTISREGASSGGMCAAYDLEIFTD